MNENDSDIVCLDKTDHFVSRARKIHESKYDYSLVDYKKSKSKVKIICFIHGCFEQTPNHHLSGYGCPMCGGNMKSNTEKFIEKASKIHDDEYDYSLVNYIGNKVKVKIVCKKHGIFEQIPSNHLRKKGCSSCGVKKISASKFSTQEEFIEKASVVHGRKYDYSLVDYETSDKKVKIICKKHGIFEQNSSNHLSGQGCPLCGKTNAGIARRHSTDKFIESSIVLHGNDKYDYSLVDYQSNTEMVKIICKKHGMFKQRPDKHLQGHGCQKCGCNNISKLEADWLNKLGLPEDKSHRQVRIKIGNKTYKVDGFESISNTVYEFLGDYWHGNPRIFKSNDMHPITKKTYGQLFQETMDRIKLFEVNGYKVVYVWEKDFCKNK